MISTQIIIQFGTGTLAVGCAKIKYGEPDQWYIAIRPNAGPPKSVGDSIEVKDFADDQEIILTFPTEKQMLTVKGAFVNKSYEETKEAWDKALAEKEVKLEWTTTGIDIIKLREKWPKELERFNDAELAEQYAEYCKHDGRNDERFLEWIVATDG